MRHVDVVFGLCVVIVVICSLMLFASLNWFWTAGTVPPHLLAWYIAIVRPRRLW